MIHELLKCCCPKCSHIFFRLEEESMTCPKCHEASGIAVAAGRFKVGQTLQEIIHEDTALMLKGVCLVIHERDRKRYKEKLDMVRRNLEPPESSGSKCKKNRRSS